MSPRPIDLAPTTEIGTPFRSGGQGLSMGASNQTLHAFHDPSDEYNPALRWPRAGQTYEQMRADPQVSGLVSGLLLPLRRYRYALDGDQCVSSQVEQFAEDVSLPVLGQDKGSRRGGRRRGKFNHDEHLEHVLLSTGVYGVMAFEPKGIIDNNLKWRLKKLSPRMPHSWEYLDVDRHDGGPVALKQHGIEAEIPIRNLVLYPWGKEGANWYGRPLIRPLYAAWYYKDMLQKINAIKHERNGAGIPMAIATDPDVAPSRMREAQEIAMMMRVGRTASAALPPGTDVVLKAVQGQLPNTEESIKYYDEAMARALMMMVVQLGMTQSGSRALGSTFADLATVLQEVIAAWYEDIFTQFVIEPYWDRNFGEDSIAPSLVHTREFSNEYSVTDLVTMMQAGAISPDPELEAWLRDQGGLPSQDPAFLVPPGTDPALAPAQNGGISVPDSPAVTNAPAQGSVAAAAPTKPQTFDSEKAVREFDTAFNALLANYAVVKAAQASTLSEQVRETGGDLVKLLGLSLPVSGEFVQLLADSMAGMVVLGAKDAYDELRLQGFETPLSADNEAVKSQIKQFVRVTASNVNDSLSTSTRQTAQRLFGPSVDVDEVSEQIRARILDSKDTHVKKLFRGLLHAGYNIGRHAVFRAAESSGEGLDLTYEAHEQMDTNTCGPCAQVDGTVYPTLDDALVDYPDSGYRLCKGEENCRGILLIKYTKRA
jgi:hypothetical protein